ncbi:hypothetical protein ACFO4E_27140 [Nocardiopsis mangrovi]|uniref:Uncharacterized protein n=1 Tax=Nocardiopsis mangrovi TaxID=1179818 RepID=A0ABV9E5V3_9ACTN
MRKAIQAAGLVIAAIGVSGTVDRLLGHQPIMGFLNVVNRFVIPHVDALAGYELFANLVIAVLGISVFAAATRIRA